MMHIHEAHYRELVDTAQENVKELLENTKQFKAPETRERLIARCMVDLVMRQMGIRLEYDSALQEQTG